MVLTPFLSTAQLVPSSSHYTLQFVSSCTQVPQFAGHLLTCTDGLWDVVTLSSTPTPWPAMLHLHPFPSSWLCTVHITSPHFCVCYQFMISLENAPLGP